jgi:hypothetical protein
VGGDDATDRVTPDPVIGDGEALGLSHFGRDLDQLEGVGVVIGQHDGAPGRTEKRVASRETLIGCGH